MAAEKTYALYIDDSGTKEYAAKPGDYETTGNSRYFVFGGVLLTTVESGRLSQRISAEKQVFFGQKSVEIKSNWLRIPRERERRYLKPFGLTNDDLKGFVESYYKMISSSDLTLFAAVVDKVHTQEDYEHPWYAPAVAYEILMQRIVQRVRPPSSVSVIIDDMTGATPKGRQYRVNLKAHHEKLRRNGSQLIKGLDFSPVIPGIRFVDSAVSHMIQVADIISYNVYRQFVQYGEMWERGELGDDGKLTLPTYNWFDRLGFKFCQGPGNRIQGYGVFKFPLRKRIPWSVEE